MATVAMAQQPPMIPMHEGLTIVTAIHQDAGDFESIKRVTAVNGEAAELSYTADVPEGGDLQSLLKGTNPAGDVRHIKGHRTIRRRDLTEAHEYALLFGERMPRLLPGTTAVGVSTAVLNELKTKGETSLTTHESGLAARLGGLLGLLGGEASTEPSRVSGTLRRVEPQSIPLPVLVNDERVTLPAVHARGKLGDDDAEFFFLDDPNNPLSLRYQIGDTTLHVVKIAFPTETSASPSGARESTAPRIERELERTGRADVYGIYFDFASAVIKEESGPVLKEIAAVLTRNATWKLSVEGHTDNIGDDAYNLDLSKKRAAAVKEALVARYHIPPARLATGGFGASRPKDTNDTLDGRARNRRVELLRQ